MRHWAALLVLALAGSAGSRAQEDQKQKIRLLRELARQGSPAIERIAPYLQDEDVEVRREAVKAIVQIGTVRSLDPLVQAARDNDPEVQIRAVDGMVNFYLPGYVERGISATLRKAGNLILGRWSDAPNEDVVEPDTPVRKEIVETLARLIEGGSSIDSRANAARAAGILRARDALPALVNALRSRDSRLIFEALIAMQKIRDRSVADRVAFLVRDLDERVQLAAIETAGILGSQEAVPQLHRVLDAPRNQKVRRAAVLALAQIAREDSRNLFLSLISDKDEQIRAAAAEGLGRIRKPQDATVLEKAWSSESRIIARLAIAFARVRLGNRETGSFSPLGYLVNNLNQRAWRGVALPYLSELALDRDVRSSLYVMLGPGATREEKTGIAQALAASGGEDSIGPLEKLAKDEDAAVAREALRALRILRGRL
ncbi:MAG: HEAT repeat domain-containing protein [Bryobacteraceae bacterium]|nr:HEAT repeat domain-containing protein [Bryobacteraceae bacterium]